MAESDLDKTSRVLSNLFKFLRLRSGEDMEKLLMGMYKYNAAAVENSPKRFLKKLNMESNVTQQFHF